VSYTKVTIKVTLDGAFFRNDPTREITRNIQDMLDALADEMETMVQEQIAHLPLPRASGWSVEHTTGYRVSTKTGKKWTHWAAVAAYTHGMSERDAIRTKAAAAGIERRFHPYRKTATAIRRSRAVLSADLAKGLR
jgi:hypothetical protein